MAYYFINTDAVSLGGLSPHDKWFEHGYAFSGGPINYGESFGRMDSGDICLMYANKIGVVGVGFVVTPWDGQAYTSPLVYQEPYYYVEYRIKVEWVHDLRGWPITPSELRQSLGWNPSRAFQRIRKVQDEQAIQYLIDKHRKAE